MFDPQGKFVAGHNPAFESTSRVIAERRLATLREIVQNTSLARDTPAYCRAVLAGMSINPFDLPFALLYSCTRPTPAPSSRSRPGDKLKVPKNLIKLHLEGSLGVPEDHPSAPVDLVLRAETVTSSYEITSSGGQSHSQSQSQAGSSSMNPQGVFNEDDNLPWPFVEAISTGKVCST